MRSKIIPEFYMRSEPEKRAGFVPGDDEGLVELWQLWCRMAEGEDARRATFRDLQRAGFVEKEKCPKPKPKKPVRRR